MNTRFFSLCSVRSIVLCSVLALFVVSCGTITLLPLSVASDVHSIYIENDFYTYGPVGREEAHYTLQQAQNRYVGEASFVVAKGSPGGLLSATPRTEVEPITIPTNVMRSFFQLLATSPIVAKIPATPEPATDYYPSLRIELRLDSETVTFLSTSQQDGYVPWVVQTATATYYINSDQPTQALALLQPYLKADVLKQIEEEVRKDYCTTWSWAC